jgi:hypothetical protein
MKNVLSKIFEKENRIIIGVIHFPPLLGYKEFPGLEMANQNAIKDLIAFEEGGIDGIIIENNYDIPHKIIIEKRNIDLLIKLGKEIRKRTRLPIGVSVLWNDFKAALTIAKTINAQFVRVPVFVDKVETSYGIITGTPKDVIDYQRKIKAQNIAIFTDIHVKHAKLLSKKNIEESALEAIKKGSDALIITGKWTGDAPDIDELKKVRETVNDFPILVGSGANEKNIKNLLQYANGAIVSTSLKEGGSKKNEVNVKSWKQRIDKNKVKRLVSII